MPLDGATFWQPSGWTIRIGLARERLAESRHWSRRKRRIFQKLVMLAAYAAIDAIQAGHLYRRNDQIFHRGSRIKYFFRCDHREKRTILITITRFHFFGPDEPDGRRSPLPLDLLTLFVSGSGRRYRIDRLEGIMPVPRPPARNRIVALLDPFSPGGDSSDSLNIKGGPKPGGRKRGNPLSIGRISGNAIYYSPRGLNNAGRILLELDSLYPREFVAITPRTGVLAQLGQALTAIGLRGKAKHAGRASPERAIGSAYDADEFMHAVIQRDASAWPSTVAQVRLQLQNRPIGH